LAEILVKVTFSFATLVYKKKLYKQNILIIDSLFFIFLMRATPSTMAGGHTLYVIFRVIVFVNLYQNHESQDPHYV
jgi:hypothetical protein